MGTFWFAFRGASLALALGLLTGCVSYPSGPNVPTTGDLLEDSKAQIALGRPEDQVLWGYRGALEAMRRERYAEAATLLDNALVITEGMLSGSYNYRSARALFGSERAKMYIGEPYERAMAWFYRGVLYWIAHEPQNARACFRSAQLQDALADSQDTRGDFALFDYADAWITDRMTGADSNLKQTRKRYANRTLPSLPSDANAFFFVEMGRGPRKTPAGTYGERIGYIAGSDQPTAARVKIGSREITIQGIDNLTFQATTRGDRVMDQILANQVGVKEGANAVGDLAIYSGALTIGDKEGLGAGLIAAGILSKAFSGATRPEADIRGWNSLPQFIGLGGLNLPKGVHTGTVTFLGANNQPIPNLTQTISLTIGDPSQDLVVFLSDHASDS